MRPAVIGSETAVTVEDPAAWAIFDRSTVTS